MKWRALVLAIVVATIASACGDPAGAPDSDTSGDDGRAATGLEGSWVLLEGVPTVSGFPITLLADSTGIGGTSACNSYFGEASISGDRISISQLGWTEMGCEPNVMESEAAFVQALVKVTAWSIADGILTLTGDGVTLIFEEEQPAPTEALAGTAWMLETLSEEDMARTPVGDPALLVLEADGTFRGTTGCRSLTGRWVERGAEIDFPEMSAEGLCPAEVREQDGFVIGVLGDGFRPTIDGDLLTIASVGNQVLVYRAVDIEAVDLPEPDRPVSLTAACGHADLGDPLNLVLPDVPLSETARAALEPYLAMSEGEFGFFSGYEWFLAEETGTYFAIFGQPLDQDVDGYADARFELRDGVWAPSGWGTCHPTVNAAETPEYWGLATWTLDPDNPPDPDSTAIPVLINERNCANGEAPLGREILAQAVEEEGKLIITVLVQPVWAVPGYEGEGASCPSNPWHATVIDVNETPEGRALYDGSVIPAEERPWPPEPVDL